MDCLVSKVKFCHKEIWIYWDFMTFVHMLADGACILLSTYFIVGAHVASLQRLESLFKHLKYWLVKIFYKYSTTTNRDCPDKCQSAHFLLDKEFVIFRSEANKQCYDYVLLDSNDHHSWRWTKHTDVGHWHEGDGPPQASRTPASILLRHILSLDVLMMVVNSTSPPQFSHRW